jgi:hypothetical protein
MVDTEQIHKAIQDARNSIRRIHPEFASPMLLAEFQATFLKFLDVHELFVFRLENLAQDIKNGRYSL